MRWILLAFCLNLNAQEWTKTEIYLEAAYQSLLVIDYNQTSQFHKHNNIIEMNPLLPLRPSQRTINTAFIASSIGHIVISEYMGSHRREWQTVTLALQVVAVANNYRFGVSVKF